MARTMKWMSGALMIGAMGIFMIAILIGHADAKAIVVIIIKKDEVLGMLGKEEEEDEGKGKPEHDTDKKNRSSGNEDEAPVDNGKQNDDSEEDEGKKE